jgi:hypothetical protein
VKQREQILPLGVRIAEMPEGDEVACNDCDFPSAVIRDGMLFWQSRHHGKTHVNAISVEKLKTMMRLAETR